MSLLSQPANPCSIFMMFHYLDVIHQMKGECKNNSNPSLVPIGGCKFRSWLEKGEQSLDENSSSS